MWLECRFCSYKFLHHLLSLQDSFEQALRLRNPITKMPQDLAAAANQDSEVLDFNDSINILRDRSA